MQKLLRSAALGGVIVYLWSVLSWMALPWHRQVMHPLEHDVDVVRMLDFGTPSSGLYVYPSWAAQEMTKNTPTAFIAYCKEGMRPKGVAIALGLALQSLGAFLLAWLLSKTAGLDYRRKVLFAAVYGLAVGFLGSGPNWIWWRFAADYTLVSIADAVIGWTLAGLAIGKVL